jgi:urease accessory protein
MMPGLSRFRSLPIVEQVLADAQIPEPARAYAWDTITLGWEERLRARARRRTDRGTEFATALPRGTILRQDDCLVVETLSLIVAVVEAVEPVLVVRPQGAGEMALFAYHIGNSHQPLMIDRDALVCPDSPMLQQVLAYHRIPFTRETRPFTPVGRVVDHQHARSDSTSAGAR